MEIVKNHYIPGERVKKYSQIESIAAEMIKFLEAGINKGEYSDGYALAHNQVEDKKPLSFFIVHSQYAGDGVKTAKLFESQVIMNPEIIEAPETIEVSNGTNKDTRKNVIEYEEGCFSFPYRKPRKVKRFFSIKVRYYIPRRFFGMKKVEKWIEGLQSHVFQHEEQHCRGKNIYFEQ